MKMSSEQWRNDNDRVKLKYWDKSCLNAGLSTTNSTSTGLEVNADFRCESPSTNRVMCTRSFCKLCP